jgi:hypothetical protein
MPAQLSTEAIEESTYPVTVSFTDEAGAAVIPTAATWTLSDKNGNVVNSREDVVISSLAASVTIVLSGDDLALSNGRIRKLTIKATYNSSLGNGLPLKDEVTFLITNLVNVP